MNTELLNVNSISLWGVDLSLVGTVALIFIMVTMGFTLKAGDFKRLLETPKPIFIGLSAQLILLPLVAFSLVYIFQPPLPIAMGIVILSCCPSGATSNFFSHLARGNVAISVSLTALSGSIVIFTIPLLVNLAIHLFSTTVEERVYLPVLKSMLQIFVMIILPVSVGMGVRAWKPAAAIAIERYATKISFAVVVLLMVAVLIHIQPVIMDMLASAGLITVLLNVSTMAIGFGLAIGFKLEERDMRSICIEVGVQNYLLSVVIAIGLLKNPSFAIVPIIYLFVMYITVFSFIGYCRYYRDYRDRKLQFS